VAPVPVNRIVRGEIEVKDIQERRRGVALTCSTKCFLLPSEDDKNDVIEVVTGEAKVLLPIKN